MSFALKVRDKGVGRGVGGKRCRGFQERSGLEGNEFRLAVTRCGDNLELKATSVAGGRLNCAP